MDKKVSQRMQDFYSMALQNGIAEEAACQLRDALNDLGFFEKPASLKYHGAYDGGLYEHSKHVFYHLDYFTEKLGLHWGRPESPFIIAMFHDLVKCKEYYREMEGMDWKRHMDNLPHGHSSVLIGDLLIHKLTDEEKLCIEMHMGPYEYYDTYSKKVQENQNVMWVHTADMMAAHVDRV